MIKSNELKNRPVAWFDGEPKRVLQEKKMSLQQDNWAFRGKNALILWCKVKSQNQMQIKKWKYLENKLEKMNVELNRNIRQFLKENKVKRKRCHKTQIFIADRILLGNPEVVKSNYLCPDIPDWEEDEIKEIKQLEK